MQKEQLSALMDGETLDSELLNELAHNPEMQKTWESYHLIRDSMRGDTPEVLHFDRRASTSTGDIDPGSPACAASMAENAILAESTSVGGTAYPNGRSSMRIACSYRWRPAL